MIKYIETHIVDHCNLKCAGCTHFSPLADEYFKPLEEYKIEMQQLHKITNGEIRTIRIMGGEPFLHPNVLDFCVYARDLFPNSSIVIASNGTLLGNLSDGIIELFNKYRITLCISDYGLKLNTDKLSKFKYCIFYGKQWMYNPSLDLSGNQPFEKMFHQCDMVTSGCYFLKNGRIYQCALAAQIDIFNKYFNKNISYDLEDISIDIFSHTENEIKTFLSKPCDFCKYCNTSIRYKTFHPFYISKKEISEWTLQ